MKPFIPSLNVQFVLNFKYLTVPKFVRLRYRKGWVILQRHKGFFDIHALEVFYSKIQLKKFNHNLV